MTYAKNNIWNKRLPRGLGLFVLLFSLGTIFWLSRNAVLLGTKAAVGNTPKDVQISNIDKDSFTVSYTTDEAVSGAVSYGLDQNTEKVGFDKRDTQTPLPHNIHYINLTNLAPGTKYLFSITSGDEVFKNGESFYEATTDPATTASTSAQTKITGRVLLEGGSTPPEAIAYINSGPASPAGGSKLFSTLVQPDGSYTLSESFNFLPEAIVKMRIVNQTLESNITLLSSQTDPIPPITLSKNYDFSISTEPLAQASASESAQITGFPTPDDAAAGLQILTPKTDQEFKDLKPLFKGTAIPGNDVEITIESNHEITTTVQADENGSWEFRPDTELEPGEHTITVKTLNAQGILQTLTRSFTVFAQGSQFVEPSVSPTAIPTPTPTSQPTPTSAPSATPTIALTSTPSAAPTPTLVPSPTTASPSATTTPNITIPPIPQSGSSILVFGLTGLSILIGIGSLLFFLL